MLPKVSVLMSVYNGEKYLRQSIESIIDQSYKDFEFIIINDASTDNSRNIILSYDDPRVRILDNPRKIGLTKSLNRGLREASGEIVARMDADDICLPDRLEKQLKKLLSANADVCFCMFYTIKSQSNLPTRAVKADINWDYKQWRGLFENSYTAHSTAIFRRDSVLRIGGYDDSYVYAQDYDLWDRCLSNGFKIVYCPEKLLMWRWHEDGITGKSADEQHDFARVVSYRAISRLLPVLTDEEIKVLRWLFLKSETRPASFNIDAYDRIHDFIEAFKVSRMNGYLNSLIWKDIAKSLAYRLSHIPCYSGKRTAIDLILKGILQTKSLRCLARVVLEGIHL